MWPFRRRWPMSAAEISAQTDADHYAYLRKHGLSGPSPNNMGTPENPYGALHLSKEYQDYIAKCMAKKQQSSPAGGHGEYRPPN